MSQPNGDASLKLEGASTWYDHPFQLKATRLREVKARILAPDEKGEPSLTILTLEDSDQNTDEAFWIGLLFEAHLTGKVPFEVKVLLEGRFEAISDVEGYDSQSVVRFKRQDAVMILWPYLRETVNNLTERMQIEMPPLPVITFQHLSALDEEE